MIQIQMHIFAIHGVLYEFVRDTEAKKTYLLDERGAKTECGSQLHQIREAITKLQGIGAAPSQRSLSSEFAETQWRDRSD